FVHINNGVLKHDVWVTGFELQLRYGLEEVASVDLLLGNAWVFDHFCIMLGDRNVGERFAVHALNIVRAKQIHIFITLSQVKGDVRDDDAQRQGLDADLLIGVFTLSVEEVQNVWVVRIQIHCTRTLASTQLVRVRKCVFQHFHDRNNARRLVFDVLNWSARLANVAQQQSNAAAALGQLQRRVNSTTDGLHVVLDAEQETGNQLTALCLTSVEESWGSWLEATRHDLINHAFSNRGVTVCQAKRGHRYTGFKTFAVATAVKGLQGVGGVVLVRTQKGLKAEFEAVRAFEQGFNKFPVIGFDNLWLVVRVFN